MGDDEEEKEDNFYLVLKKYAELYGDDDGKVSSEVFTPLNEVVKLMHFNIYTDAMIDHDYFKDVINFVEKNKAYKEAYSASLVLERNFKVFRSIAYLLQIRCLIEGWGCEGNAEDKRYAREMLEDWLKALEAEKDEIAQELLEGVPEWKRDLKNQYNLMDAVVNELLYCYNDYVLSRYLPPSEINKMRILTVHDRENRQKRLRELIALYNSLKKFRSSCNG